MKAKRSLLSLLLCGAVLLSLCTQPVFAEADTRIQDEVNDSGSGQEDDLGDSSAAKSASDLCEHHTEHTGDCGYTEETPGTPCGYACSQCGEEESPQDVENTDVRNVQAMLDKLPRVEEVESMSLDERREVFDSLQMAGDAYEALPDGEQEQMEGAEILEELFCWFDSQTVEPAETVSDDLDENEAFYQPSNDGGALTQTAVVKEDVSDLQNVYETLIALRDQDGYKEGTLWDDTTNDYSWNGGPVAGNITGGTGCAAFAFELSDKAFGSLPARTFTKGNFKLSDVKAGDILRIENNSHSVIVLQVTDVGVIIAEANYHVNGGAGTVHWNRSLSKVEVEAADYFITRYPESYLPPDDPTANDVIGSGNFGNLAWKLTKAGTLTISGSGTMPDYASSSEQPWKDYRDQILKIVIEDGVTRVGNSAFWDSAALSVKLPTSVEAIGNSAFRKSSLIAVSFPASVKTIDDSAFRECSNLGAVSLPEGVETIGGNAFFGCTNLKSVELPASVGNVGAAAFMGCTKLTQVTFASSDKCVQLGDNVFTECWMLMSITLPKNADRMGEGMFQNCLLLTSLNIPQGADSIGGWAFASCSALTQVGIPNSVKQIGIAAFSDCRNLKDIYFSGSETEWNSIQKLGDVSSALSNVTIHYHAQLPETPSIPVEHEHSWVQDWSSNSDCHWHECSAENCNITDNSGKAGYGGHVYDNDGDASCNTCGYTRTLTQPDQDQYRVTVNGSYAPVSGAGSYEAGTVVTIYAGSRSNYRFKGWSSSDGIDFANAGSASTTFTMPDKPVTVTASWTYIRESSESGSTGSGGGTTSTPAPAPPPTPTPSPAPTPTRTNDRETVSKSGVTPTYGRENISNSGVTLSGSDIHKNAQLTVTQDQLHDSGDCDDCGQIREWQAEGRVLAIYDVSLSYGFHGTVTLTFPVSDEYNGKTLAVAHCLKNKLEICDVTVSNGEVTLTVDSLSPFVILDSTSAQLDKESSSADQMEQPEGEELETGDDGTADTADLTDVANSQKLIANVASRLLTDSDGGIFTWGGSLGLCVLFVGLMASTAAVIYKRRGKEEPIE
ncbi:MAG: leucine-rich repeat protein [Lachnospiraceae bacterium]|nr:leucine-rich repeat protein [Lachnospiraceae bacterium]